MSNPWNHIKAWVTKHSDSSNEEDYITSTDIGTTKRGLDFFPREYLLEVQNENIAGAQIINKFGADAAVGTNFAAISSGSIYRTPKALVSLEVVSDDNTNDIPTGIGARKVRIWGLNNINGVWTEDIQDVALNGTTAVAVPNQKFRAYKMRVIDSGSYADESTPSHNSTITLRVAGGGDTWAIIDTENGFGLGSTEIGAYSIPKGVTAYLLKVHVDVEATKIVDVIGFIRDGADIITAPFTAMNAFFLKRGMEGEHEAGGDGYALAKIVGPADIGFMSQQSGGVSKVEVEFDLLCIED